MRTRPGLDSVSQAIASEKNRSLPPAVRNAKRPRPRRDVEAAVCGSAWNPSSGMLKYLAC